MKESKTFLENKWFAIGLIVLVSLVVYYNSLKTPFVFDDIFVTRNYDIRHFDNIKTQLSRLYKYDRPLTYLTFSLNYYFGKLNTFGYHLFNVILHIFNAILIFYLTKKIIFYVYRITSSGLFSLSVALLFVVHPVNTEVVTYIYNRSASLTTFFYIASLLCFIKTFEKTKGFYFISMLFFILSLLSKQVAATLPLIILIFDYIFLSNFELKKVAKRKYYHLSFWIILFIVVIFLHSHSKEIVKIEMEHTSSKYSYLITQPWIIVKYLQLLLVPVGLYIDRVIQMSKTIFEFRVLVSFLAILGIFIVAWKSYKKRTGISKIILFCVLWFFINLLPTNIFIVHIGERHAYLPSFGFYLGIVCAYFMIFCKGLTCDNISRRLLIGVILVHVTILSIATVKRNQQYQNPIFLWQDVVSKYPENYIAHNNLGVLYEKQKEYTKAIEQYQKAIEINPDYAKAHYNLGVLYKNQKEHAKEVQQYQKTLQMNPDCFEAHTNLGALYERQKQYDKAIKEYQKALEINPNCVEAYNNIGNVYKAKKQYDKAIREYRKALEINPDYADALNNLGALYEQQKEYTKAIQQYQMAAGCPEAHYNLGVLYARQKKYEKAIGEYRKALQINPDYAEARNNLGVLYEQQENYTKAIGEYQKALETNPNFVEARNNLGNSYLRQKEYDKAIKEYQKALRLKPDYADAHNNLGAVYYYQKQYGKALQEFEYILKLNPADENIKATIKMLKELVKKD